MVSTGRSAHFEPVLSGLRSTRTTKANGALRYIPGSHKVGIYSHRTDNNPNLTLHQVIDDPRFEEGKARYAELEPGQISLHDVHLLHGSAANQSGDRRAGFSIRYMPSTSVLRRDLDMSRHQQTGLGPDTAHAG